MTKGKYNTVRKERFFSIDYTGSTGYPYGITCFDYYLTPHIKINSNRQ